MSVLRAIQTRWKWIVGGLAGLVMVVAIALVVTGLLLWNRYRTEIALVRGALTEEKSSYLVLFQNSMELRATGGFIGNFAEVNVENGRLRNYILYNTNNFDFGKPGIPAPEPFTEVLAFEEIQLRDANWSPDFPTTAQTAMDLYALEGGQEDIEGVIAINTEILPVLMEYTGPIYLETLDKTVTSEDVLLEIQYDTNYGFLDRGVARSDRKQSVSELAEEIEARIWSLGLRTQFRLAQDLLNLVDENHVMAYFEDPTLQGYVKDLGMDGALEQVEGDYFMLVDANLGSLKTDLFMDRDITIAVEPCENGTKLCHSAFIRYQNTALQASPLNNDYRSYTRVILPEEGFVTRVTNAERNGRVDYEVKYGKKIAGFLINIPFNSEKTIRVDYTTPVYDPYSLYVQKQSGVDVMGLEFKYEDIVVSKKIREDLVVE